MNTPTITLGYGGWGWNLGEATRDYCPNGDYSGQSYDGECGTDSSSQTDSTTEATTPNERDLSLTTNILEWMVAKELQDANTYIGTEDSAQKIQEVLEEFKPIIDDYENGKINEDEFLAELQEFMWEYSEVKSEIKDVKQEISNYTLQVLWVTESQKAEILSRKLLSQMSIKYVEKIWTAKIINTNCSFNDISQESAIIKSNIIKACQYGIMGLKYNGVPDISFNPNGTVTQEQLATVFSRIKYGGYYNGNSEDRAWPHLEKLYRDGYISRIAPLAPQYVQNALDYVQKAGR